MDHGWSGTLSAWAWRKHVKILNKKDGNSINIICVLQYRSLFRSYVWPERFNDSYECMIQGYEESGKKIAEIGQKMSTNMTSIKFESQI